ncbi:MAG TPA: lamin tail domain-containing protein [Actinoplanes sp.]|nr:lamin tail domain-containing protein [Actinoplanes sp.]
MLTRLNPHTRQAPSGRLSRTVIGIATTMAGLATVLLAPTPALAADPVKPTISVPALFEGYGRISITGTARPGATVELHEAAYVFRTAIAKAEKFFPEDIVETQALADGTFTMSRIVDSGFVFAVVADGIMSDVKTVTVQTVAELQVTTTASATVHARVQASPGQPFLTTRVQRKAGSDWVAAAEGPTADLGVYTTTLSGQPAGTQTYRAQVSGDPQNALVASRWVEVTVDTDTNGTTTSTPGAPVNPPTPPAPPKPPAPAKPAPMPAGAVQLTKIVYNPAGTDTGSNTHLNKEYARLTNKTSKTISLKNWTLRDAAGHVYKFSPDYALASGKHMYVLVGKGTNGKPSSTFRYWGSKSYIWNNSGDTAILRDSTSKTIDTCRWGKGNGITYC